MLGHIKIQLDQLGWVTTYLAVLFNLTNINLLLTLAVTALSIIYLVIKIHNQLQIRKKIKKEIEKLDENDQK